MTYIFEIVLFILVIAITLMIGFGKKIEVTINVVHKQKSDTPVYLPTQPITQDELDAMLKKEPGGVVHNLDQVIQSINDILLGGERDNDDRD